MFFFFPVRDEYRVKSFPVIIAFIIAVNTALFFTLAPGPDYADIVYGYGFIPSRFSATTLFTSMFLHGGIFHLASNMWYLWLLGNNIEDRWGRLPFLLFYLSAGIFSMVLYSVLIPERLAGIPAIGASGAISAVLGAYAVLFPGSKITFKYFIWIFIIFIKFGEFRLHAWIWLAFWFAQQSLSTFLVASEAATGQVAFGAHFAGFIYGLVIGAGTKLYREAKFRENVQMGENMLFRLLGGKQVIHRTIEEFGEIERAKMQIGEALGAGDMKQAGILYAEITDRYPETVLSEKQQYAVARELEKQNNLPAAATAYKNFLLNYPFSKSGDKALLALGKILLETDDLEKAKYALLQIVLFYPYSGSYEQAKHLLERRLANRS